jgi:hypothetical protein
MNWVIKDNDGEYFTPTGDWSKRQSFAAAFARRDQALGAALAFRSKGHWCRVLRLVSKKVSG